MHEANRLERAKLQAMEQFQHYLEARGFDYGFVSSVEHSSAIHLGLKVKTEMLAGDTSALIYQRLVAEFIKFHEKAL